MPDEYLPPNKILFLQNLPESVTKDQLLALFSQSVSLQWMLLSPHELFLPRYPNLHEVRLIPTKRDIAFVEFLDEGSAGVAKDALHNYKLDGENKIKVRTNVQIHFFTLISRTLCFSDYVRKEVGYTCTFVSQFCSIINNSRHSATFHFCYGGLDDRSPLPQYHEHAASCSMLTFFFARVRRDF